MCVINYFSCMLLCAMCYIITTCALHENEFIKMFSNEGHDDVLKDVLSILFVHCIAYRMGLTE